MGKTGVKRLILGYFALFFGAVLLRIDYFPLSWVPMYSLRVEKEHLTVAVGNLDRRELGFTAIRANGEKTFLSRRDLNIPPANFRRLYQERAFGEGPYQHTLERIELNAFNRWWYDNFIGPDPAKTADYPRGILKSVNRTFDLRPADPRRFVQLEAHLDFATFSRAQLAKGDLRNAQRERRVATIRPEGTSVSRTPLQ